MVCLRALHSEEHEPPCQVGSAAYGNRVAVEAVEQNFRRLITATDLVHVSSHFVSTKLELSAASLLPNFQVHRHIKVDKTVVTSTCTSSVRRPTPPDSRVVHGSILCDPIQTNGSAD